MGSEMNMRTIERVVRELASNHKLVLPNDVAVSRVSIADAYRITAQLPNIRGQVDLDHRELLLGGPRAIVEVIDDRLAQIAAELRGRAIREYLDSGRGVDFFADSQLPEHEQAERLAVAFAQLSEQMFKRAKREGA